MISVQEAQRILQEHLPDPIRELIALDNALGHYLFEDIQAPEPSPRYTNSAMDGYAVRWEDCSSASSDEPVMLRVIGESQAGIPFDSMVSPGTAVRISTGAMLPDGADTVVRVEDTTDHGREVSISVVRRSGQDVRKRGEEFSEDHRIFRQGTCIGARELALMAAVGLHTVPVYKRPEVSLLVTGSELVCHDDTDILDYQIRDSNTIMLAGSIQESGARLCATSHVQDNLVSTVEAVQRALASGVKLIICSGGVSVGRHDHVREASLQAGFSELFWKIRQKPGKPLFAGVRDGVLLFGLPGNPVSAYMCFRNFVRPVLAQLQGVTGLDRTVTAKVSEPMINRGNRTLFHRVNIENLPDELAVIREVSPQGSHMLSSIVGADGYIELQPGEELTSGDLKEVILF